MAAGKLTGRTVVVLGAAVLEEHNHEADASASSLLRRRRKDDARPHALARDPIRRSPSGDIPFAAPLTQPTTFPEAPMQYVIGIP
jgi:hypothetical protein